MNGCHQGTKIVIVNRKLSIEFIITCLFPFLILSGEHEVQIAAQGAEKGKGD